MFDFLRICETIFQRGWITVPAAEEELFYLLADPF
jgi:hypothetical protein